MSVIGGIILFAVGAVTGGGVLIYNQKSVRKQTAALRRENEHLKECAWRDRLEFESSKAYRRGYRDGHLSPAIDAETFAVFAEDWNTDFRGPRWRRRENGRNGKDND